MHIYNVFVYLVNADSSLSLVPLHTFFTFQVDRLEEEKLTLRKQLLDHAISKKSPAHLDHTDSSGSMGHTHSGVELLSKVRELEKECQDERRGKETWQGEAEALKGKLKQAQEKVTVHQLLHVPSFQIPIPPAFHYMYIIHYVVEADEDSFEGAEGKRRQSGCSSNQVRCSSQTDSCKIDMVHDDNLGISTKLVVESIAKCIFC